MPQFASLPLYSTGLLKILIQTFPRDAQYMLNMQHGHMSPSRFVPAKQCNNNKINETRNEIVILKQELESRGSRTHFLLSCWDPGPGHLPPPAA